MARAARAVRASKRGAIRLRSSWAAIAALVVTTGCSVVARDHACWPWLSHQYEGHVPSELVRRLAHEHGTKRQIGSRRAPNGYYWRKRQKAPLDVTEIRTLEGGYELAACPHAELVPTGAALLRRR